jgi:hypothetical protein
VAPCGSGCCSSPTPTPTNTAILALSQADHGHSEADIHYVARRYFTLDGARAVAVELANATFAARQSGIWGEGTTTVASDSTHFRSYDQNLFTEWHSRYGGRGVLPTPALLRWSRPRAPR